ncbi:ATPase family protein associated with various cellular activities (AAA) [Geothermobacter ehrlichii]|uniref:ATPase family protein associated with various cellular activities (AAA) n=1 Tax=Geothermobacter ehrlichii TaxID=213224 RepID=A0A5D3WFC8_9BACT|nr:ATP-binding protein [Geothermobacter ehrlichii]TYO96324.1 ATPase family protein associated with various cellular activities (AAA) [Geothermobacter ehrlichii]
MISEEIKKKISKFNDTGEFMDFIYDNEQLDNATKKAILSEAFKRIASGDDLERVIFMAIDDLNDFDTAKNFLISGLHHITSIEELNHLSLMVEGIAYGEEDRNLLQWCQNAMSEIAKRKSSPYVKMLDALHKSYKYNQRVYVDRALLDKTRPVRVPVFSGPTGMGKTTTIKKFATEMGFDFIALEGSVLTAGDLLTHIQVTKEKIMKKSSKGVVVLIERFNQLCDECKDIIQQYSDGDIDAVGKIVKSAGALKKTEHRFRITPITELFVVGEVTT